MYSVSVKSSVAAAKKAIFITFLDIFIISCKQTRAFFDTYQRTATFNLATYSLHFVTSRGAAGLILSTYAPNLC